MFFLLVKTLPSTAVGKTAPQPVVLRCWINVAHSSRAEAAVRKELANRGFDVVAVEACTATTREDYFPPCESLDAFERAEEQGFSYLPAPEA